MEDPAWKTFQKLLGDEMARTPRLTSSDLATRLALDEATIANWRRGRGAPELRMLPKVVVELNRGRVRGDGTGFTLPILLQKMGLLGDAEADIDAELVEKAIRLQKLELKLDEANATASQLGRSSGADVVVRAAVMSGRWAVGVWPAYEGPPESEPIHVADRIDIFRTEASEAPLTAEEVWGDADMKSALRAARAIQSSAAPRLGASSTAPFSRWSVLHLGSPREPLVTQPWPRLHSLCFLATSTDSWVNDVAAVVAMTIGYGLTSVRDLTLEIQGVSYNEQSVAARLSVHDRLVADPPTRRIWSYFGPLRAEGDDAEARISDAVSGKTTFVILDESEDFLEHVSRGRGEKLDDLRARKHDLSVLTASLPAGRVIVLPVQFRESRSLKWQQVLEGAHETLTLLDSFGLIPSVERLRHISRVHLRREPSVFGPIQDWLTAKRS